MGSSYIIKLISKGEGQNLDFKFEINDSKKIARSLSAFANTDGGKLLIGVKDNGVITGVRSDEEYYMLDAAAKLYCKPEIKFTIKNHNIDGKTVVEAYIPKSGDGPYYSKNEEGKWMIYIRKDDQNLLANSVLLKVWKKEKRKKGIYLKYTKKEKALLHYLLKNKTITLSKYVKLVGIPRKVAENVIVNMIVLKIIEMILTEKQVYYQLLPDAEIDNEQFNLK